MPYWLAETWEPEPALHSPFSASAKVLAARDGEEDQEAVGQLQQERFFLLFEVAEPLGARAMPACLHVPLT